MFEKELTPIYNLFQKIEKEEALHNSLHGATIPIWHKNKADNIKNENYRPICLINIIQNA